MLLLNWGLMWTAVDSQQVGSLEHKTLQCELGSENHSRQKEVFRMAQSSFNRYRSSCTDQVRSEYASFFGPLKELGVIDNECCIVDYQIMEQN